MTNYDDETLMRRVDGELPAEETRRLDAAAATSPKLAKRLRTMSALRVAAADAFPLTTDSRDRDHARLIAAPRPPRISPWVRAGRGLGSAVSRGRTPVWVGLAMAAFVGGVLAAPLLGAGQGGMMVTARGDIADQQLIRVLDQRLAAEGPDAGGRAVGLTFRNTEGQWCRTFQAGDAGLAGLACRTGDEWSLRGLAPVQSGAGEIRTASADMPIALLSLVDATASGDTLDAAAETRARDSRWR